MKIGQTEPNFYADGQRDRQTDGQTEITKLLAAFRSLANLPNKLLMMSNFLNSL